MPRHDAWSREELDFLSDHYGKPGWNSVRIAAEKPGPRRSVGAIQQKARYIGLADPEHIGNWRHDDPKLYEDLYDLAVLDYSSEEIARSLRAQHGVQVTGRWVSYTIKRHLPKAVHRAWVRRTNQRRARSVADSWKHRKRA